VTDNNILAAAIAESDWTKGPKDAKVSLIEYGDFQCPACGAYFPMVERIRADYDGKILFAFRNFPLYSVHPNAGISAQAAEAAGIQGKYWEMNKLLYEKQTEWSSADPTKVVAQHFNGYARSLGLDVAKFDKDINISQVTDKIKSDVDGGNAAGVAQTPTFYVNLKQIQNPSSYEQFKTIIDQALASS